MSENNKFKIFAGIRSFMRLEGGLTSVTDIETKVAVVEESKPIYDMLKLLLKEEQFNVFEREFTSGSSLIYDFNKQKLYFIKDKVKYDTLSEEMNLNLIEERFNDKDNLDKYFI